MAALTITQKAALLSKMNSIAKKVGLGGLFGSHKVLAAGLHTSAGGDATESITVTGATTSDIVHVTLRVVGATPRTILTAVPAADAITVVLSGDPSTDHVLQYEVLRAL
jgi:hypothetical protein